MKKYKTAEEKFLEIVAFKEKHNRMPHYKVNPSQEDAALEKSLYSWMQAMKMAKNNKGTAKYPEWLDQKAKEHGIISHFLVLDKAMEQFKNLVAFYEKNKRKPKRYKANSKSEEKLAHWVNQMRQERKKGSKRYPNWLDEHAEKEGILDWFILQKKEKGE
jgi:hypothetical protein